MLSWGGSFGTKAAAALHQKNNTSGSAAPYFYPARDGGSKPSWRNKNTGAQYFYPARDGGTNPHEPETFSSYVSVPESYQIVSGMDGGDLGHCTGVSGEGYGNDGDAEFSVNTGVSGEKGDVGVEGSCDMLPRRQRERANVQ